MNYIVMFGNVPYVGEIGVPLFIDVDKNYEDEIENFVNLVRSRNSKINCLGFFEIPKMENFNK